MDEKIKPHPSLIKRLRIGAPIILVLVIIYLYILWGTEGDPSKLFNVMPLIMILTFSIAFAIISFFGEWVLGI